MGMMGIRSVVSILHTSQKELRAWGEWSAKEKRFVWSHTNRGTMSKSGWTTEPFFCWLNRSLSPPGCFFAFSFIARPLAGCFSGMDLTNGASHTRKTFSFVRGIEVIASHCASFSSRGNCRSSFFFLKCIQILHIPIFKYPMTYQIWHPWISSIMMFKMRFTTGFAILSSCAIVTSYIAPPCTPAEVSVCATSHHCLRRKRFTFRVLC